MIKETAICDFCKVRLGKNKCDLCDKDMCSSCCGMSYDANSFRKLVNYNCCLQCHNNINKLAGEAELLENSGIKEIISKAKEQMKPLLIKAIIAKTLETKNEQEEEYGQTK